MAANTPEDARQDNHASACRRRGKMAVLTLCGRCNRPVVGVVMRPRSNQYCIECKSCGYSAISRYERRNSKS
jgi:transcription elongation factor Elf1